MLIHNMTQHQATPAQQRDGVTDFSPACREELRRRLTFEGKPDADDIRCRAAELADWAAAMGVEAAMLGGAPFFMPELTAQLKSRGIRTFFAYSPRRSTDRLNEKGEVEKCAVFAYEGLLEI